MSHVISFISNENPEQISVRLGEQVALLQRKDGWSVSLVSTAINAQNAAFVALEKSVLALNALVSSTTDKTSLSESLLSALKDADSLPPLPPYLLAHYPLAVEPSSEGFNVSTPIGNYLVTNCCRRTAIQIAYFLSVGRETFDLLDRVIGWIGGYINEALELGLDLSLGQDAYSACVIAQTLRNFDNNVCLLSLVGTDQLEVINGTLVVNGRSVVVEYPSCERVDSVDRLGLVYEDSTDGIFKTSLQDVYYSFA